MISRRGLFGLFAGATAVAVAPTVEAAPVSVEIPEYEWVESGLRSGPLGLEFYRDINRQSRVITGIDRSAAQSFWNTTKSKEYSDDRI